MPSQLQRRERMSKQLLRVVTMLEIVHRLGRSDTGTINRILNDTTKHKVCMRTTYRDLNTMLEAGFLIKVTTKQRNGFPVQYFEMERPEKIIKLCDAEKVRNGS